MSIAESIQKNREVFCDSSFFSPKTANISAEIKEQGEEKEHIPQKILAKKEYSTEKIEEKHFVQNEEAEMHRPELIFHEEPLPNQQAEAGQRMNMREISDELERLSQRYGRGMEEWLRDQSSL